MKIFILLGVLIVSHNARAFTFNNSVKLVFAQDEVPVNVAGAFCANIGIDETELLSIVGDAVDQFWNKAPTSRLKLRKGSVVTKSSIFHTDNICEANTNCDPNPALAVSSGILITCNNNLSNFPNSAILGITIPNNISASTILGSLIMINDRTTSQFDTKSRSEKVAIIAHELGHAIGLGHSPVEDSLMYFATVQSRTNLGCDDIDGISYLYPKKQPVSCGTIVNDLDKKRPDILSGLLFGFLLVAAAEATRKLKAKTKAKLYT